MKTHNENEILLGGVELTSILKKAGEFLVGLLLSAVELGGMNPFGLSFAAVSGGAGALGTITGYLFFAHDSYRCIFTVLFCCILKRIFRNRIPVNAAVGSFFFTVWGTLLAEILGILTVTYTFGENMLFALGGIIAGVYSCVAFFAMRREEPKTFDMRALRFICRISLLALILTGIGGLGSFALYIAYSGALFSVLIISGSGGLVKAVASAGIIDAVFLVSGIFTSSLSNASSWMMALSIAFTALLCALLRNIPKYFTVSACLLTSLLSVIYNKGSVAAWVNLLCVLFSAVLYALLNAGHISFIYSIVAGKISSGKKMNRKPNVRKSYKSKPVSPDLNPVCSSCSRRLLCWVKDYSYTSDVFINLTDPSRAGAIPSHFEEKCPHTSELIRSLRKPVQGDGCRRLMTSKATITKRGEKTSGDNIMSFTTKDNKQIFCILDGMGSGEKAAAQSRRSAEIFKKLIESGIEKREAVEFLNEQLTSGSSEAVLGADIMIFDLNNGILETVKAGAAPTFIIRNGRIYELGSQSLPIGVLNEVYTENSKCRIRSEDTVVMVSDGFLSDGAVWLGKKLSEAVNSGASGGMEITERILEEAERAGFDLYDDLSIIAVKVM